MAPLRIEVLFLTLPDAQLQGVGFRALPFNLGMCLCSMVTIGELARSSPKRGDQAQLPSSLLSQAYG